MQSTVLVEEMDGTPHRAVAGFLADLRNSRVEFRFINLVQSLLVEELRGLFHFCRDRRLFIGQIGMICTGLDRTAACRKMKYVIYSEPPSRIVLGRSVFITIAYSL